jgi:hypothetical protein
MSQSALVIDAEQQRLAADPNAPSRSPFICRDRRPQPWEWNPHPLQGVPIPILNYTPQPVPETKYNIVVVAQEYDGFADFPDRPIQLATANAIAGTGVIPGFDSEHAAPCSLTCPRCPRRTSPPQ